MTDPREDALAKDGFAQYRRSQIAELRPWREGDDMSAISVSAPDKEAGSPKPGDMVARNPKNHADQWLVAARYFADNFESLTLSSTPYVRPAAEIRAEIERLEKLARKQTLLVRDRQEIAGRLAFAEWTLTPPTQEPR